MIAADHESTFDVTLQRHAHLPLEERPTFTFRFMRRREAKHLRTLNERGRAIQDVNDPREYASLSEAYMQEVEAFLVSLLRGWRNVLDPKGRPIRFEPGNLDLCIDDAGMAELLSAARLGSILGPEDKKKSALPSPSSTEATTAGSADVAASAASA